MTSVHHVIIIYFLTNLQMTGLAILLHLQDVRAILSAQKMERVIDEYETTGWITRNKSAMVQVLTSHQVTSMQSL